MSRAAQGTLLQIIGAIVLVAACWMLWSWRVALLPVGVVLLVVGALRES